MVQQTNNNKKYGFLSITGIMTYYDSLEEREKAVKGFNPKDFKRVEKDVS